MASKQFVEIAPFALLLYCTSNILTFAFCRILLPVQFDFMQNMFLKKHQIFTFQWQGHWRELGVSRFFPSNSFFDGIKKPKGDTERCKAQAKSWAIVRVQVVSDYATEITRSRRMTFSDQLANLGE